MRRGQRERLPAIGSNWNAIASVAAHRGWIESERAAWGPCGKACPADINGDGIESAVDVTTVLDAWGPCD